MCSHLDPGAAHVASLDPGSEVEVDFGYQFTVVFVRHRLLQYQSIDEFEVRFLFRQLEVLLRRHADAVIPGLPPRASRRFVAGLPWLADGHAEIAAGVPPELVKRRSENLAKQQLLGAQLTGVSIAGESPKQAVSELEAELVKLARFALDGPRFDLIRGNNNRLTCVPEQNGKFFIKRCHTGP